MVGIKKKTYAVVRAVYNHSGSLHDFERELDLFLTNKVGMIIIEPESLGEVTWRWIRTGNWLHKTAVVCGVSALATAGFGLVWNTKLASFPQVLPSPGLSLPSVTSPFTSSWLTDIPFHALGIVPRLMQVSTALLSVVSVSSAGFYALFWQWDPCCKYQVARSLADLPRGLKAANPGDKSGDKSPARPNGVVHPLPATSVGSSLSVKNGAGQLANCNGNSISPNGSDVSTTRRPVVVENRFGGPPLRPVVLIHHDDGRRKILHNTVAVSSSLVAAYLVFRWYRVAAV